MADARGDVEEAISSLGRGDVDGARSAMFRAMSLDRTLIGVADAVALACAQLEADGEVSPPAWNILADACPDELRPAVEAWRR